MTTENTFTVGQKVICHGYDGTVTEIHGGKLAGMVDVRLDRGAVCVPASELARFNNEEHRVAWTRESASRRVGGTFGT